MTIVKDVLDRLEGDIELPAGDPGPDGLEDPSVRYGEAPMYFDLFPDDTIMGDGGGIYAVDEVEYIVLDMLSVLRHAGRAPKLEQMQTVMVRISDLELPVPLPMEWCEETAEFVIGTEFLRFGAERDEKFDLYPDGMVLGYNALRFTLDDLETIALALLSMLRVIYVRRTAFTN